MTRDAMERTLAAVAGRPMLCVGDVMLDVEVPCDNGRLSAEAPVLVFDERAHRVRAGGAANVAANAAALGMRVHLAGIVGADDEGATLQALLTAGGIASTLETSDPAARPTTRKTRFVAEGRQLLRIDRERHDPIDDAVAERMVARSAAAMPRIDAVLISDYGKGCVTEVTVAALHALAARHAAPLLVDPKGTDWRRYGEADVIKPNAAELALFTGLPCDSDAAVATALAAALDRCRARAILVTRAAHGASLLTRGAAEVLHVEAIRVEVSDVCGAGDTNLATLGAFLATGCDMRTAIEAAQWASSIAVRRQGNAVVGADDLCDAFGEDARGGPNKVRDRRQLAAQLRRWRGEGLRIGFTNGCFDILHPGHIRALQAARAQCDRLVVGLNADASVRRLKGHQRPVIGEIDRAAVLAGLASVDAVVLFDEDRPDALIAEVRPDVLVKGGDYTPDTVAGGAMVRGYGGNVVLSDILPGRSTTGIVERIVRLHADTPRLSA